MENRHAKVKRIRSRAFGQGHEEGAGVGSRPRCRRHRDNLGPSLGVEPRTLRLAARRGGLLGLAGRARAVGWAPSAGQQTDEPQSAFSRQGSGARGAVHMYASAWSPGRGGTHTCSCRRDKSGIKGRASLKRQGVVRELRQRRRWRVCGGGGGGGGLSPWASPEGDIGSRTGVLSSGARQRRAGGWQRGRASVAPSSAAQPWAEGTQTDRRRRRCPRGTTGLPGTGSTARGGGQQAARR